MADTLEIVRTKLFIDGRAVDATGGREYGQFNPARPKELVGHAALASEQDVDTAVRSAHAAFPKWAALSFAERAILLRAIAAALTANEADVAKRSRLFTREHGKITRETMMELSRLGDRFMLCASYADRLAKDEELQGPPFDTLVTRQPRGVAALIVPWNWPLSILGAKLPQALITGNTVVVKPAQNSALAPSLTLKIVAEMLPPGVLNIVTGSARDFGDGLVGNPLVRNVNFTGSISVGKHVM